MGSNSGNFREEPPENYDGSEDEWLELSYSAQYYYYNKEDQLEYNKDLKNRRRDWFSSIKDDEYCRKCGESHNNALDFHHVEDKTEGVTELARGTYSKERIIEEINKCVILCANCHRKHHAGDLDIAGLPKGLSD